MNRATPRKPRHRHQPSSSGGHGQRAVVASDYESDVHNAEVQDTVPDANPLLANRSIEELNLGVLRRYAPSISTILSIHVNAVIYAFGDDQAWKESGVEGTLFICEQESLKSADGLTNKPRACCFILNRRGLDNVILDLARASVCELEKNLLMFQLEDESGEGGDVTHKVLGLWLHHGKDDVWKMNFALIQDLWRTVRPAEKSRVAAAAKQAESEAFAGGVWQATGRKLSMSDLFGQQNGDGNAG